MFHLQNERPYYQELPRERGTEHQEKPMQRQTRKEGNQEMTDRIFKLAIKKDNLLTFYNMARKIALKTDTIISSFRKTEIWPIDHNAIPLELFEPAKNTQAAQPLPAH
jgi:hypothetical protein